MPASPSSSRQQTGRVGANGRSASPLDPNAEDFYQVLGVPYTASALDITRAYRAAMKRVHPDRHRADRRTAAEEHAKRLNLAYATLAKPAKRLAYDRSIRVTMVQDQIMSRYVGGFGDTPAGSSDSMSQTPRRKPTAAQRRERARSDRNAMVSIVVAFGGITVALIALLLAWALIDLALQRLF